MAPTAQQFHFGDFTLDRSRFRLQRAERALRLERIPMELLLLLVQRRGELVSREEIAEHLWGKDVYLDFEHGINTAVRKIRLALRDDPDKPRFVETVVGKGYRFAAPVTCVEAEPAAAELSLAAAAGGASVATVLRPEPLPAAKPPISARLKLSAAVLGVLALVTAGVLLTRPRATRETPPPPIRSLAVLPLRNLSADASQEYLADGMTEALIDRLAQIHQLRVISWTSVMRLKNSQLSAPEISRMLGADALVEGSVMREGDHIRITAQLIRGATDDHFWSETYDRDLPDVLSLQSEVAQAIARKVEATVSGKERDTLAAVHRVLPDAYESFLKGQYVLHRANSKADLQQSVAYFEETLRQDPGFARAYVSLAAAHSQLGTVIVGGRPDTERQLATAAARKALQLDPNLGEAHLILGDLAQKQWRWAEAEAEYRRALELNPNDADAYASLAQWLLCHGRIDEALASAERSRDLDRTGDPGLEIVWILFNDRRYDDAIREVNSVLQVRPRDAYALWQLGFALIMKGEPERAIPVLEQAATVSGRSPGMIDLLAAAYARAGRRAEALRILDELKARERSGYVPAASFIITYMGLGDYDRAFAWIEKACQEHSNILQFVKVHPLFDPLRQDPRFAGLVQRVGL
ncbi:MAG TPA: tetratricopeptide repeat protein [Terriglobales bacterium]|nr:tetratricopeptide repeat protein [Terriglobales bacterium]